MALIDLLMMLFLNFKLKSDRVLNLFLSLVTRGFPIKSDLSFAFPSLTILHYSDIHQIALENPLSIYILATVPLAGKIFPLHLVDQNCINLQIKVLD